MKYLWILFALLISFSAVGQADLLTKKGFKYYYKDKKYKCKELGIVYKESQNALDLYNSGRGNVKAANILGYTGLGFIVLGTGGLFTDSFEGVILGGLSILTGLVVELIALVPRGIGNGKLKKARKTFNFEMIERKGYNSDTSLSLGITRNGFGFVYQF